MFTLSKFTQIDRDTFGKLQCHPYPQEYVDSSKPCAHCAFFMGLQRKPGEAVQEGQQFDIRGTVEEFKHSINMYMFWKPGMEICVSHVRRKQIPSYVFPEGYKRSRHQRVSSPQQADKQSHEGGDSCQPGSGEKILKRKKSVDAVQQDRLQKRQSISPPRSSSVSPDHGSVERIQQKPVDAVQQDMPVKQQPLSPPRQESISSVHSAHSSLSSRIGSNLEPINSDTKEHYRETSEIGYVSNASIITSHTSEVGSCEDTGNESVVGSCEGINGSVEGSNDPGTSLCGSCEADSQSLSESGHLKGNRTFQIGMQEELEVLNLSSLTF